MLDPKVSLGHARTLITKVPSPCSGFRKVMLVANKESYLVWHIHSGSSAVICHRLRMRIGEPPILNDPGGRASACGKMIRRCQDPKSMCWLLVGQAGIKKNAFKVYTYGENS